MTTATRTADRDRNRSIHIASLTASKLGDGLVDPKLVLSWLLTSLGAPAAMVGLLVPVREALALLPQLLVSDTIRSLPQSKLAWAAGAGIQGTAAAAMALAALTLDGWAAGAAILGLLAILAMARSVCSAAYKHVLGKTVEKGSRGGTTGRATTLSSAGVLVFAALLILGPEDHRNLLLTALILAGASLIFAGASFTQLSEPAGEDEIPPFRPLDTVRDNLALIATAPDLQRFIAVRALLTATALAPPFLVALAPGGFGGLGTLLAASAVAGMIGGSLWGWLSDRSSRLVLAAAGVVAALGLGAGAAFGAAAGTAGIAAALFAVMVAHQGVRLGRSTHLTDMATAETRAGYTAASNTAIGLVLLAGGLHGLVAATFGPAAALAALTLQVLAGAAAALWLLDEVQGGGSGQ